MLGIGLVADIVVVFCGAVVLSVKDVLVVVGVGILASGIVTDLFVVVEDSAVLGSVVSRDGFWVAVVVYVIAGLVAMIVFSFVVIMAALGAVLPADIVFNGFEIVVVTGILIVSSFNAVVAWLL